MPRTGTAPAVVVSPGDVRRISPPRGCRLDGAFSPYHDHRCGAVGRRKGKGFGPLRGSYRTQTALDPWIPSYAALLLRRLPRHDALSAGRMSRYRRAFCRCPCCCGMRRPGYMMPLEIASMSLYCHKSILELLAYPREHLQHIRPPCRPYRRPTAPIADERGST